MLDPVAPEEKAYAFHEMLSRVLKLLNQSGERAGSVEGLELVELERALQGHWSRHLLEESLSEAVGLLEENGLVRSETEPIYAWDRHRTLGSRYLITPLGKAYLVRQLEEADRIR